MRLAFSSEVRDLPGDFTRNRLQPVPVVTEGHKLAHARKPGVKKNIKRFPFR
jgi:hypothetical protein